MTDSSTESGGTLTAQQIEQLASRPDLFSRLAGKVRGLLSGTAEGQAELPAAGPDLPPALAQARLGEEEMPVMPAPASGLRRRTEAAAPTAADALPTLPPVPAAPLPIEPPAAESAASRKEAQRPADDFGGYRLDIEAGGGIQKADKLQGTIIAPDGARFAGIVKRMPDGSLNVIGGPAPVSESPVPSPADARPPAIPAAEQSAENQRIIEQEYEGWQLTDDELKREIERVRGLLAQRQVSRYTVDKDKGIAIPASEHLAHLEALLARRQGGTTAAAAEVPVAPIATTEVATTAGPAPVAPPAPVSPFPEAPRRQEVVASKKEFAKLRRATLDAVLANKRGELTDALKREGLRTAALSNSMLRQLPREDIDSFLISIGIVRQQEYTLDDYQMEANATIRALQGAKTVLPKLEGKA